MVPFFLKKLPFLANIRYCPDFLGNNLEKGSISRYSFDLEIKYFVDLICRSNFDLQVLPNSADQTSKGSFVKDVRRNLGTFTPPSPSPIQACPHLVDQPPTPVRVDTKLALLKTLQLVNNSY